MESKNVKIYLVWSAVNCGICDYSIEAGLADGFRHFDHHGEFSSNPSPCNDERIKPISGSANICITHVDADCYVGILRLLGKPLPEVNLGLMEKIDLNGSSIVKDLFNKTLLYMIGVGKLARKLGFPRNTGEAQDVTDYIVSMMLRSGYDIIRLGKRATEGVEDSYRNCRKIILRNIGFWAIDAADDFDPSRPYRDNIDVVVIYRMHYRSISIYCNPKSNYEFAGKTIAGIPFQGHPKASGSPRGKMFTEKDGYKVFDELTYLI